MLYLIGLGLNEKGISLEGQEIIKKCRKVYLENYTVEFPYSADKIEKVIGKKIIPAGREIVESMNELLQEAEKSDIALLIYGSPLTATTHISLIEEAKKRKIKYRVIYSGSVLDAVAETGLQLYKFGKIASIPNFEADSFAEIIKENQKINAHSLILADIGLKFQTALERLEKVCRKNKINPDKIAVCEKLGTPESRIYYNSFSKLKKLNIKSPFCFIIPGKLHFFEKEILESFIS